MGAIKDGTVSGFLPSAEAFAVHYPGYPSSAARAIETLKGTEGIMKARSLQSNKLELFFRPEDPYSHPAFGELRPCNNFLLKISKKKSSDGQSADASARIPKHPLPDPTVSENGLSKPESDSVSATKEVEVQTPEEDQINLCAEIVARVPEAYHFDGMVDYQHVLAVHAEVARRKKRNWAEVEQPQSDKVGVMDMDQEDVMILVPPLFSHKDLPEKIVLRPSGALSSKKKQEGVVQHCWEMDIEPCLAIHFNVKEIPKKVNWEEFMTQGSEQWKWQMAVSKLFDEKPIWLKDSLAEQLLDKGLDIGDRMLKRLLFRTAYYFSNGPFLRFWIRKGYDPRKDPESRIYQRIDFRVPPSLRSHCDASAANEVKHRWEDIRVFRVFPHKCQTSFQLFELADDYIQQEIRKPSKQTSCSCGTGWFSPHVLDSLRLRVMVRFLSVYPKTGAENLLKAASDRFEKSKRMRMYNSASKLDEQEHQQFNREPMVDEDKEEPEIVGDGKEDEFEIDNEEEELDAYEALDLAGEDGEISLQSHSYLNTESISRTYLQDLFGSFPSTDPGGDKIQDVETSDGEYQIYEQDSDDHYSDDDYN